MTFVLALIGVKALYLLFIWLASAIAAEWLSTHKGYSAKAGLASGLLLSALGVIVWLLVPAKPAYARGSGIMRLVPKRGAPDTQPG
jgi:hypothetical protein